MSPSSRLLNLTFAWLLLAVPSLGGPWLWLGGAGALVVLIDAMISRFTKPLDLQRRLPGRFASGEPGEERLVLRNESARSAKVEIFDGIPQGAVAPTLLWCGVVVFLLLEVRRFSFLGF